MNATIFLDETGSAADEEKLHLGVGGLLASDACWEIFNPKWRNICAEFGIQEPFHMTDFAAGQKQFKEWKEERRRRLLGALVGLISSTPEITPIGAVVCMQAYRELKEEEQNTLKNPYYLALATCIRRSALNFLYAGAKADISEPIHRTGVVLAKHPEYGQGVSIWTTMKESDIVGMTGMFMSSITKGVPFEHPGLQAADLVAYEMGRYFNYTLPQQKKLRWAYEQISTLPNSSIQHAGKQELQSLLYEPNVTNDGLAYFFL